MIFSYCPAGFLYRRPALMDLPIFAYIESLKIEKDSKKFKIVFS